MAYADSNYEFIGAFVDGLAGCGLNHVCICPGSRSTPLTISFARHPNIKTWMHLDERSASYFALGLAKSLGEPVALVCTSGTAAANFFPAVIEAKYSFIPLVVLTADRPPELWDWGANQTVDQQRLYGTHAKWFSSMPLAENSHSLVDFSRAQAYRAIVTCLETPAGPVHLNFPFREPLEPSLITEPIHQMPHHSVSLHQNDEAPYLETMAAKLQPHPRTIHRIASTLNSIERGIIVCGPQFDPEFPSTLIALSDKLNYPILADTLSQIRTTPVETGSIIASYDLFLREPNLIDHLSPDIIIRFGATPTSKSLGQFLDKNRGSYQIIVSETGWNDPSHIFSEVLRVDPSAFCNEITSRLKSREPSNGWREQWKTIDKSTTKVIKNEFAKINEMFEGKLFTELAELLPNNSTLFAGNSMPIRDLDSFLPVTNKNLRILSNRGASGIDGVLSTALGAAAVSKNHLVLVLGDLSFYHDMNGLLAAKAHGIKATIIVINNDGGGIFSFLPQAKFPDIFEKYFGTPHGLTFEQTAKLYGLSYKLVEDWSSFRTALIKSFESNNTNIIEIPGDRNINTFLHRKLDREIINSLNVKMENSS